MCDIGCDHRRRQPADHLPGSCPNHSKSGIVEPFRWCVVGIGVTCVVFIGFSPCALGQAVYGSIFGTVTDSSGAAMPRVRIAVSSPERGTQSETVTNGTGNYELLHLLPGRYTVTSQASGFKTSEITDVPVHIDQASRVNLQLQVGGVKESVTVSANDVPLLKTERADVAITFNERYIKELPILNRNFTALELISPGTSPFHSWQHASGPPSPAITKI